MDTLNFILTLLLVAIIDIVVRYFQSGKTQKTPNMHLQIESEQNETDTESEMLPASESHDAGGDEPVTTTEITTVLVPSGKSATSCAPHVFNAHSPSPTSPSAPLPAPSFIGSYHEIVSALTRYGRA
jgi:hypothetical protein